LPEAAQAGFLPPDNTAGRGEGFVTYTVRPKSNLATGTTISQQASVVFDTNAPLATNTFTNTIDGIPPTASISNFPAFTTPTSFLVGWPGTDRGPGIASYDVFVSDNGAPFTASRTATTATSATFPGAVNGHTYGFFLVATDNAGNRQPTAVSSQATTL